MGADIGTAPLRQQQPIYKFMSVMQISWLPNSNIYVSRFTFPSVRRLVSTFRVGTTNVKIPGASDIGEGSFNGYVFTELLSNMTTIINQFAVRKGNMFFLAPESEALKPSTISLQFLDVTGSVVQTWVFSGAYLTSIGFEEFDWAVNDIARVTGTFIANEVEVK